MGIHAPRKTSMCWYDQTLKNSQRVYAALRAFGAPLSVFAVEEGDFADYEGVLQIGLPPRRIDIVTSATGISFQEASEGAETLVIDGRTILVIGLDALLKNKAATGRPQDLADVDALHAIQTKA